jgi:hypothetical protein
MPQNETNHEAYVPTSQTADDNQNAAARLHPGGIEPELTVLRSENLPVDDHSAGFAAQVWHRPYAEALIETDPARLQALIAEAERAISTRYLQLSGSSVPWDEGLDLLDAIHALSQLKKAIVEDWPRRAD